MTTLTWGLNAPYGAPRFLTEVARPDGWSVASGLNAPYGAPRFLAMTPETIYRLNPNRS